MSPRAETRCLLAALAVACLPGTALAHAALVEARPVEAVAIEARFEDGTPMAGAQVAVFAPDAPATPWLTGTADAAGRFVFAPGPQPGRWAVQARLAGHGAIAYVARGAAAPAAVTAAAARPVPGTPVQRAVMAACVLWGLVGTALYFRRKAAA